MEEVVFLEGLVGQLKAALKQKILKNRKKVKKEVLSLRKKKVNLKY